ncbi:MAG: tetratricopeptide repeat protein [Methylicorpusculum sp.]|uniref:tetratricopeptide repeat protein n=1 Tax=Methylicorpusculum sp. TaxID=2713644 RepID=UPI0027260C7E|nr:tetratricopeptide repeat protein [Methylicorpusculum sp.]MDO8940648.1 tetratricopeptide repeat protein [Methylicorpusculum sp.]MDP2203383.1 tetratricopeptide repeat protein [Methylicorpusculum sp.]
MPKLSSAVAGHSKFRLGLALIFILLGLSVAGFYYWAANIPLMEKPATFPTKKSESLQPATPANHVGATECQQCHQAEFDAWQGSHHAMAMQEANERTVLGDFNNSTFNYYGIESTFFKRDGEFMVRTDGPDGKLTDYPIKYTFGVMPLQQYLIAFPGGRYQALGVVWDSRPKAEGGQRWFHLYPDENIDYKDQLHWTGRYQNWNMQCAECHSTNLKKGYDAATDSYLTTFNEINVACEACHGPASQHVVWAKQDQPPYSTDTDKGLSVKLESHWQNDWIFAGSDAKFAHRVKPVNESAMNTCWACHARRLTLVESSTPGLPLEDSHRPALLTQPTYYADGQQRDEDYTWGSFRQSKMFQNGVTCMDCHEPHALKLRAEGNALCIRCHNAETFDTEKHHFHRPNSKGEQCMECHAPEQNYMVIDGRHDHSFRLPRPDLSQSLGSPNACNQCHRDRKPEWAAATLDSWYGKTWRERPHYGHVLHNGVTQGFKALPALIQLAQDIGKPAIVRATAINLSEPMMNQDLLITVRQWLKDSDPSVRIAALGLIEAVDPVNRILAAAPLLNDPIRGVRIEAFRILADVPNDQFPADNLKYRALAEQEYRAYLALNADWPSENVNLGNLEWRQGRLDAAIAAYQRALRLDPQFAGAYVNLADVYRQLGRDSEGEKYLRQGLSVLPKAADLHHALGLTLIRKANQTDALNELAEAYKLAPDNGRYAYVYAIGLNSVGKSKQAIAVLKDAETHHPFNMEILNALISMHLEMNDGKMALVYAKKAAEAMPANMPIKRLVDELSAPR